MKGDQSGDTLRDPDSESAVTSSTNPGPSASVAGERVRTAPTAGPRSSQRRAAGADVPDGAIEALNAPNRAQINLRRHSRYLSGGERALDDLELQMGATPEPRWALDTVVSEIIRVLFTVVLSLLALAAVVLASIWVANRVLPDDLFNDLVDSDAEEAPAADDATVNSTPGQPPVDAQPGTDRAPTDDPEATGEAPIGDAPPEEPIPEDPPAEVADEAGEG